KKMLNKIYFIYLLILIFIIQSCTNIPLNAFNTKNDPPFVEPPPPGAAISLTKKIFNPDISETIEINFTINGGNEKNVYLAIEGTGIDKYFQAPVPEPFTNP